jgi:hypothetical protein
MWLQSFLVEGMIQSTMPPVFISGKEKEITKLTGAAARRVHGAGQKPKLDDIEELLADEVINLRIDKVKVTRNFIHGRARQMAVDSNIEGFKASPHWITLFLRRNNFSRHRMTNLTML